MTADANTEVYFGMTDGSVWLTPDGGKSFRLIIEGLPGWLTSIAIVPAA